MEEINQNNSPNQPIVETQSKDKNIYKYLFFISTIVLLGVIVGFYFLLNNKIKQLENKQTTDTTSTIEKTINDSTETEITPSAAKETTDTASLSTDESNNLQTYINKDYGFSFKYPSTWSGQINKTNNGAIQRLLQFDISPNKSFFQSFLGAHISIMLINDQDSPTDWYKKNIDLGPFETSSTNEVQYESKNLTINGYKTFYVKQTTGSYTDNTYVLSDGKDYIVYMTFRESEKHYSTNGTIDQSNDYSQYLPVFSQIVNSIEFN